jgi:septation ring formation regulator EzrA
LKALEIDDKVTQLENHRKRRERLLQLKDEIRAERDLKAELKEQLKEIKRDMGTRLSLVGMS